MRRRAARLILPPVLSALIVAGCGSDPPGQEDDLRDASAAGAGAVARPGDLYSAPGEDSHPLPTDGELAPAAGDEGGPAGECDPNYDPCVPIDSDVDCAGGGGNGPSYVAGPVRVVGSDPYGLDRDGDGIACEK